MDLAGSLDVVQGAMGEVEHYNEQEKQGAACAHTGLEGVGTLVGQRDLATEEVQGLEDRLQFAFGHFIIFLLFT